MLRYFHHVTTKKLATCATAHVAANSRLPASHSIYWFKTSAPPRDIMEIDTRNKACVCERCFVGQYNLCTNTATAGKVEVGQILPGGNPADRLAMWDMERDLAIDALERADDFSATLKRGDYVAIAARMLDQTGKVDDDCNKFTIVLLDRAPYVRQAGSPMPVLARSLVVGSAAAGYSAVGPPLEPMSLVVSGHPFRRAASVPLPGKDPLRCATMYECLTDVIYFPAGLIRHSKFGMVPMPPEFMSMRAMAIATGAALPGSSRPTAKLTDAFRTDGLLYRLREDDAAVIATSLDRRAL